MREWFKSVWTVLRQELADVLKVTVAFFSLLLATRIVRRLFNNGGPQMAHLREVFRDVGV